MFVRRSLRFFLEEEGREIYNFRAITRYEVRCFTEDEGEGEFVRNLYV